MADLNRSVSDSIGIHEDAGQNIIVNADFESAPSFVAVQTTGTTWMDGSSGGSSTNDAFRWACSPSATAWSAQFDSSVKHSGSNSMKISTTDATGRVVVRTVLSGTTGNVGLTKYVVPVNPSTSYVCTAWIKTNNVAATTAAQWVRYDSTIATIGSNFSLWTGNSSTQDWTQKSTTITTGASDIYMFLQILICNTAGNVSDAWIDDINIQSIPRTSGVDLQVTPIVTPGVQNISAPKIWS